MTTGKFGLSDRTIQKITGVLAAHSRVERAVLYGSRAKGNYKNGSDIDLTLHGANLTQADLRKIAEELDDLLLPYQIDLSLFSTLNHQGLIEHIDRVGVIFYKVRPVESTA